MINLIAICRYYSMSFDENFIYKSKYNSGKEFKNSGESD